MEHKEQISKATKFAKAKIHTEPGHDWSHVERVLKTAKFLQSKEGGDLFVIELAALLHELDDWKFGQKSEVSKLLNSLNIDGSVKRRILKIIKETSFKGAKVNTKPSSLEGQIVQDADRLDAMGAIGVARAFSYGGHMGRVMYDSKIKPKLHGSFAEYKKNSGPTLNHFYEKLLLLKDKLNTKTAKKIGRERHEFMERYLDEFKKECAGADFL